MDMTILGKLNEILERIERIEKVIEEHIESVDSAIERFELERRSDFYND